MAANNPNRMISDLLFRLAQHQIYHAPQFRPGGFCIDDTGLNICLVPVSSAHMENRRLSRAILRHDSGVDSQESDGCFVGQLSIQHRFGTTMALTLHGLRAAQTTRMSISKTLTLTLLVV